MTEWKEFHGKRSANYAATGPEPATKQPAAPVVVGNTTYRPLTRYTITFEVQPDPRDARIAELERLLEEALAIRQSVAELLVAATEIKFEAQS